MSEAKDKYIKNPTHFNLLNYAAELESEKTELLQALKSAAQGYACFAEWTLILKKHGVEI
jgi:hypothetical protein